jgi:hypothetical protein
VRHISYIVFLRVLISRGTRSKNSREISKIARHSSFQKFPGTEVHPLKEYYTDTYSVVDGTVFQVNKACSSILVMEEGFKPQALATAVEPSQVRRFELGNCKASATELPPSYGLARYAKTWQYRCNHGFHTKIVAVRATLVGFLFRKQVWLRETILVKMKREFSKFDKNWVTESKKRRCPFIFGRILTIRPPF